MGLILSKYEETNNQPIEIALETEHEDTIKTAPISTPNRLDPRSPSTAIARTPLELILSQKPNLNQTPINNNNCGQRVVFSIDPRSPATEFQRTPIVIVDDSTSNEKYGKLFNKNLENVRKLLINDEIITKPSTNCNKRKSIVGVLETNLDFTETNIDDVFQQKLSESMSKDIEEVCVIESTNHGEIEISNEVEEQQDHNDNNDGHKECLGISMTAHVEDFDKKLSTLIYEDKSSDNEEKFVEKLPKIRENNRTPLSVRNMNREPEKKLSKLKVSDKPKRYSRIPVFKDAHCRNGVQCENTPPTTTILNSDGIKAKASKWDGDATVFI